MKPEEGTGVLTDKKSDIPDSFSSLPPRKPERVGTLSSAALEEVTSRNRWRALLIGISDYSSSGGLAPSLKGVPSQDVLKIKEVLENHFGFSDTVLLRDEEATRRGILRAFDDLFRAITPVDNLLVYYAGHGLLSPDGSGVWLPADAQSPEDGISNAEIKDRLANLPAKRVLLVSDSCFSGSFLTRSIRLVSKSMIETRTEPAMQISRQVVRNQRVSREVLSSGSLRPVPNAGYGPFRSNSPFAGGLLSALESVPAGGVINLTDIHADLANNIQRTGEEMGAPQRGALPGHAGGEFFFVRR